MQLDVRTQTTHTHVIEVTIPKTYTISYSGSPTSMTPADLVYTVGKSHLKALFECKPFMELLAKEKGIVTSLKEFEKRFFPW